MVSAYETENASPPLDVLSRLAVALRTTVDDLLRGISGVSKSSRRSAEARTKRRAAKTRKTAPPGLDGFGNRLAQLRRQQGMSQRQFAAAVGISKRMAAYYEAQNGNPPASLLPRFARALGIPIDALFQEGQSQATAQAINLRLWQRFRIVEKLSPRDRQAILRQIRGLLRTTPAGVG
jgi:transcriptional regulator with XRE-family HTH domain